jgi:hypothetical protein
LAPDKPPDSRSSETTFDPLVAHLHFRLQQENGFLSPRSRPQYGSNADKSEETPINERAGQENSKRIGNGQLLPDDEYGFPKDDIMEAAEPMRENDASPKRMVETTTRGDSEDGVREAIRGIYRLWKAQSGSKDAESFLDIVKDSLHM